jgi:hypothetical protein
MFERLHHKNDGSAKFVHWEFEIEEGWFPFRTLSSHLVEVEIAVCIPENNGQVDGNWTVVPVML